MKKLLAILLATIALPSFAGVNPSVGVSSDYFWRGASLTGGSWAVQGSLEADYKGRRMGYSGRWFRRCRLQIRPLWRL